MISDHHRLHAAQRRGRNDSPRPPSRGHDQEDRQQDVSGAGGWEQDIQDSGHGDWDRYLCVEESYRSRVMGWADENTGAMEVANSFPNAEISLCLSPIEHGWGAER